MSDIAGNLAEVRRRITAACARARRDPAGVELIAVSKTFPAAAVREAAATGQRQFGESKLQEAEPKIELVAGGLRWHFIGRVQRNKVRRILPLFEVIHAIDSTALAGYVNEVARELGLFPKVLLQVNVAGEASKGGFEPADLRVEILGLLALDRLEVMGVMCIPPPGPAPESARPWFVALRELRDELARVTGVPLPWLSMGMSGDYEVAIEEGATHVRVGSAIFGDRSYRVDGELG
ncbi:MAG: YggS family pyridoxal phosphate-dependent enzyme [Verrucomicrobiota bacterium]